MPISISKARAFLEQDAQTYGLDCLGVSDARANPQQEEHLKLYVEKGHHASMAWMEETMDRRSRPQNLWPEVQSIISFGLNYGPDADPRALLDEKSTGNISVYARHRDYHDVFKGKLKQIAGRFAARFECEVKIFVDTAPVMEKPLAQKAGLGWQGKHTNLVSRQFGSWLFLGSIFTTLSLAGDAPESDHCGNCRACLDACPTKAFPAPYQIDARRCISYLTIEHKIAIPQEFRAAMGNHIYGCDDCLAACPWNKFAQTAHEAKLQARDDLRAPPLAKLLALDDAGFRRHFTGSPIKRIGRDRFTRNLLIAAGNSADLTLRPMVEPHLNDINPLVRGAAVWALLKLLPPELFETLKANYLPQEQDQTVIEEWSAHGE